LEGIMTTLLLALTLVAGLTPAEPAPEPGPRTPAPVVEPAATPSGPDTASPEAPAVDAAVTPPAQPAAAKSPGPSALKVTVTVVVTEGLLAALSAGLANDPKNGWVMVGLSPLMVIGVWGQMDSQGKPNSEVMGVASGVMFAGIGAYNALELSKDKYSKSDRFWLNMAAWHVGLLGVAAVVGSVGAVVGLADLEQGPRKAPASTTPSVSLGLTPGGGALLVAGQF
jgi:hypothetical protein